VNETTCMLPHTAPWCVGDGVDFGCNVDPHPAARTLVDGDKVVHQRFRATHEVHIRNIDNGFDDWIQQKRQYDFVYSSHLLEHLREPHAFLRTCLRILRPGGHLVLVLPCEDFYWPNGHPHANPDHKWWHLNSRKVTRWVEAAATDEQRKVERAFVREATAPRGGEWGFLLVFRA
jgi:SAM-dependent methyltransferase